MSTMYTLTGVLTAVQITGVGNANAAADLTVEVDVF